MRILKSKAFKIIRKYSVVLAFVNIVYAIVLMMLELHYKNNVFKFVFPLFALVVVLILSINSFGRPLKLINAIKIGVLVAFIGGVLIMGYKIIFDTLIEPDFYQKHLEANRENFFETHVERNPGMTRAQFEIDMEEARNRFWKPQYTLILLSQTLIGLMVSFFTGLILRKKKE